MASQAPQKLKEQLNGLHWDKIIDSDPFKFIVGANRRVFTIHSALVAAQSAPLNALINGGMMEATERQVVWDDIIESTFFHFSQFLYTGDYNSSVPMDDRPPEAQPTTAVTSEEPAAESRPQITAEDKKMIKDSLMRKKLMRPMLKACYDRSGPSGPRTSKKHRLWKKFVAKATESSKRAEYQNFYLPRQHPRPNVHEFENFTYVFLGHARLYVFADRYQITKLQALALTRLGATLATFRLYERRTGDVMRLLEFCYDEEHPVPDKLKDLVVHYAACQAEHLWKNEDFLAFMGSNGEFSTALTGFLLQRMED